MADEEDQVEEGAEETEGDEKKGGKKKLLMILVPILLLVGGGAGAYFMGMLDSVLGIEKECITKDDDGHGDEGEEDGHGDDADADALEECEEEHGEEEGDDGHAKKSDDGHGGGEGEEGGEGGDTSAFLAIPAMIVNLNTEDGTPRYLRLTVQLELEDPSEKAEVEAIIPRVIDQFQTYLRELRVRDLRGSAGIYRLQMELLWRVNQASDPIEIKDVLFQEILIQ